MINLGKKSEWVIKLSLVVLLTDGLFSFRAGIDGGGVFKEFLTSLSKQVFDTDRGLWLENKNNELYPNPHSYATERRFLGLAHDMSVHSFSQRIA